MRVLAGVLAAAVAVLAGAGSAAAAPVVSPGDVRPHLRALDDIARANGGNRAAGLPGEQATVRYVAGELRAAGWQVSEHPVAFPFWQERRAPRVGRLRRRDVQTMQYSGSGDVRARVRVIEGDGCRRRAYRGMPHGRVALLVFADCTFRDAALAAQRAGARAVLFGDGERGGGALGGTLMRPGMRIPVLSIDQRRVRRLPGRRVRVTVDALGERRTGHNVLAELPGIDGRRVLMAGGHLDSVLEGPGINDNASGVAALLEAAERLAAAPRPAATLRLGLWTAEEWGLLGSRAYVRSLPPAERRRILGYVNLDMVGSPNAVPEIYAGSRRIARALRRHLPRAGRTSLAGASDHAPFRRAGIPVGGLYTGSLERKSRRQARRWGGRAGAPRDPCYHRSCDALGNVDQRMLARVTTAATRALLDLGRAGAPPAGGG